MHRFVLFVLCLLPAVLPAQTPFLRVTPNGRHLQWADGRPFLYLGDTAWELVHRLKTEEAELYLQNRAEKGFTVIQMVLLPLQGDVNDPNSYGEAPLLNGNPATPNEAYFVRVDAILEHAERLGLVAGVLPTWGRHWKHRNPQQQPIFNANNARVYGEFLGKRYKSRRLIWILGGDDNPSMPAERATIDALAAGLKAGDGGTHLMSFHPRGPGLSSTYLRDATWLDFHMVQSSHAARHHDNGLFIEHDRALTPPKPTVDGEPRYEGLNVGFYLKDHNRIVRFDDADSRQAAYWAMLAGACGHTYGNNNIWQMWRPGQKPELWADVPWKEALDHPGAFQMGHLRKLFESRPWQLLEPAQDFVASGPRDGGAKIRAAVASDRSFALVYSPEGAAFTVDQTRIRGERLRESWFDPRYGTVYTLHTSDTKGFQTYTPPTQGRGQDWVLLLEDEAAGYAAGQR